MEQPAKWRQRLYIGGGAMMVAGACSFAFMLNYSVACWVFAAGAAAFVWMQSSQGRADDSPAVVRLRKILGFAGFMFILTAVLMVDRELNFIYRVMEHLLGGPAYVHYVNYVYGKWVLTLLIGAILEMYAVTRISSELGKKGRNDG